MQLLKFIEVRFRNGIRISDDEIQAYYEKTMLPEYAKRNVAPPTVETTRDGLKRCCCSSRWERCWMTG